MIDRCPLCGARPCDAKLGKAPYRDEILNLWMDSLRKQEQKLLVELSITRLKLYALDTGDYSVLSPKAYVELILMENIVPKNLLPQYSQS